MRKGDARPAYRSSGRSTPGRPARRRRRGAARSARAAGSYPAPAPPDRRAGDHERERQHEQETERDEIEDVLVDADGAIGGAARLDRDQVLVAREPVDQVHTEIAVAAVADKGVGKK